AVQRVLDLTLQQNGDRFLHLVADHAPFEGALRLRLLAHDFTWFLFISPSTVLMRAISRRTLPTWWVWVSWPEPRCMRRLNCSRRSSSRWALRSASDFLRSS